MSLEFFRKKRFQRCRHPEVFCQRVALTIPCVSSLRVTPHQILKLQLDQLGTSRRKTFSEQSSRSSSRQGVPTFVQTQPGFQTISRSRAHKDVERFSFHKGHQHCVQLICQHSQSFFRGITTSVAAFASATVADSFSTVKTSLAPGCTLTTKCSIRRAQDTNSLSVFFNGGGFPRPFVSTKVGLVRAGFAAANTADPTVCARDCGLDKTLLLTLLLLLLTLLLLLLTLLLLHLLQRLMQLLVLSSQPSQLGNELCWLHLARSTNNLLDSSL